GLGAHQVAALGVAAAIMVAGLWMGEVLPGVVAVGVAGVYSWVRVAGQPLYRWVPQLGRHGARVGAGRSWRAPLPVITADGSGRRVPAERVRLPAELGRPRWVELDGGNTAVGLLLDGRGRSATATMVFALQAPHQAALADTAERAGLVAGWAAGVNLTAA